MTLKKGYFDRRVLKPSQSIKTGPGRLDSLIFREAESQVRPTVTMHALGDYMLKVQMPSSFFECFLWERMLRW